MECTLAGCAVTVHSVGSAPLKITHLELESGDEFAVDDSCVGTWDPGDSCTIQVRYLPYDVGTHTDVLVIHQNLPGDPTYVTLSGTAT